MKVVHLTSFFLPTMGYQERYLVSHQRDMGHQVWVVTGNVKYPATEYQWLSQQLGPRVVPPATYHDEMPGVPVVRLECTHEIGPRLWLRGVEKTLTELDPDVLVVHGMTTPNVARVAAMKLTRKLGPKCGVIVDDHMLYSAAKMGLAHRLFYRFIRMVWTPTLRELGFRFVGVSEETVEFIKDVYGVHDEEAHMLPLGVDADLFTFDPKARADLRRQIGIPEDAVVCIQTGKFIPQKGQHLLLEASIPVLRRRPEYWLLLIGAADPDYSRKLRETADREGVSSRVLMLPAMPHDSLPGYYSAADIAVWPLQESMSVQDASSCGRAVIMRDSIAGRERTTDGRGRTYATIPQLTQILEELAADSALREQMGRCGREYIEKNLDWRVIARRFVELGSEGH